MANEQRALRVLLVEDEGMLALMIAEMLTCLGHVVVGPVGRLGRALELARREALDVAILDVNLRGAASYPVAEVLAARGIPFVFSTGYEHDTVREPFSTRPLLQKPFQETDLQVEIDRAMAQ